MESINSNGLRKKDKTKFFNQLIKIEMKKQIIMNGMDITEQQQNRIKSTEVGSIKQIVMTVFMLLLSTTIFAQLPAELLNPEIISINRMPMRNNAFGFENMEKAKQYDREKSANFLSLNGSWKFNWVQDPNQRPQNFQELSYDDTKWTDFRIPASWEVSAFRYPGQQ